MDNQAKYQSIESCIALIGILCGLSLNQGI